MAAIVYVHGVGHRYTGRAQILGTVVPAIRDGLVQAGTPDVPDVDCAYYGDVLRDPSASPSPDFATADLTEDEAALLYTWADEEGAFDGTPQLRRRTGGVRTVLGMVFGNQLLAGLTTMMVGDLRLYRRYLVDPSVRATIQARVLGSIRADTRVLIGHDLGSIIAYEVLCAHPELLVRTLITLGSPIGASTVFQRLSPPPSRTSEGRLIGAWPPSVQQWTNVAAHGDLVAVGPPLESLFGSRIFDVRVDNGNRAHAATQYLGAAATGAAILAGLRSDGERPAVDTRPEGRFLLTLTTGSETGDGEQDGIAELLARFGYQHIPLTVAAMSASTTIGAVQAFVAAPERGPDDYVALYLRGRDAFAAVGQGPDRDDDLDLHVLLEFALKGTSVRRLLCLLDLPYADTQVRSVPGLTSELLELPDGPGRYGAVVVGTQGSDSLTEVLSAAIGRLRESGYAEPVVDVMQLAAVAGPDGLVVAYSASADGLPAFLPTYWLAEGAIQKPGPPRTLPGVRSDEPSSVDLLSQDRDIAMLAELLAAAETDSPLAIALLGEWGAGKSSLMLQVNDRVTKLVRAARNAGDDGAFVRSVRQVTFNAWHYADAQLWPDLIAEVYRAIAPDVASAEPTADELDAHRRALRTERTRYEQEAERVRRKWEGIEAAPRGVGLFERLPSPGKMARSLLARAGEEARDVLATGKIFISWLIVGYVIFLAAYYAWPAVTWLHGIGGALLAPALALGATALRLVARVIGRPARYGTEAQAVLLEREEKARTEVARIDHELLRVDAVAALTHLLESRKDADSFERYRGLTSHVHRELKELEAALRKARTEWTGVAGGEPPLERIVLYIDDLDRCEPRQVVEILAAVRLLLALPLFIVVVAADPRWLIRSLRHHHRDLFADHEQGAPAWRAVTPIDYLDKIFQIPFALRPMGSASVTYLRELLPKVTWQGLGPTAETDPAIAMSTRPDNDQQPVVGGPPEVEPAIRTDAGGAAAGILATDVSTAPADDVQLLATHLVFSEPERDFLPHVGVLLPTPRSIKKVLNLYRLVRIGIAQNDVDGFVGTLDEPGSHRVVAVLLAFLVAVPEAAAATLLAIVAEPDGDRDLVDLVVKPEDDASAARFIVMLGRLRVGHPLPLPVAACRPWVSVVARFSFRTFDMAKDDG